MEDFDKNKIFVEWVEKILILVNFSDEKVKDIRVIVFNICSNYISRGSIQFFDDHIVQKYLMVSIFIYACIVGAIIDPLVWKELCLKYFTGTEIIEGFTLFISYVFPTKCDVFKFKKIKKLGKSNSVVYLGCFDDVKPDEKINKEQLYAVKHFKRKNNDIAQFVREVWSLKNVSDHTSCVDFHGAWFETSGAYIIMKAYDMTLADYIHIHGPLTLEESKLYMVQLLDVISYSHSKNIVHRDVKPQNIMMESDRLVLADWDSSFSSSFVRPINDDHTNPICTLQFRAPELLLEENSFCYNLYKIDIWSIACVFFFCLTGQYIFDGSDEKEVLHSIMLMRSERYKDKPLWNRMVKKYINVDKCQFLEDVLHINPTKRMSVKDALENSFLKNDK